MFHEALPLFADRREAGERLASALARRKEDADLVVLGIPRGGVEIAAVVAERRHAPLDVVVPRKLRAPGNPELGIGAVAEGVEVLDRQLIDALGVTEAYLRAEVAIQQEEIRRRLVTYRAGLPPVDLSDRVAVVVDDGVATGGTAVAALRWARRRGSAGVVLAVPVAPREIVPRLEREADDLVILELPDPFYAVGQWYEAFPQVSDHRVIELLANGNRLQAPP